MYSSERERGNTKGRTSPGSRPGAQSVGGLTGPWLQHLQRVANGGRGAAALEEAVDPAQVQRAAVDEALRSPAKPLETGLRNEMQARYNGADFSHIKVHDGSAARNAAVTVQAKAFTTGHHIVDGGGMSKKDWAHELAHAQDQEEGSVPGVDNGAGLRISDPDDSGERRAVAKADEVMDGPAPVQRIATASHDGNERHQHGDSCGHHSQSTAPGTGPVQRAKAGSHGLSAAPSIQRVRRMTQEDMETARSQSVLSRTAKMMRDKNMTDKAEILEKQLEADHPMPMQGTVVFGNDRPVQQRNGGRFRLSFDLSSMLFSVEPHLGKKSYGASQVANGKFNFVIPAHKPNKIMASQVGGEQEEGHSALAKAKKASGGDGHVYWAGTATFKNGELEQWTNDSGHYMPTAQDAPQVATMTGGAFSMDKFSNAAPN
ncbi:DUF4157 domain-containing protein [Streptomyces sp. NPDC059092]|uniref:eCIS core domain-containing protein n=1 Tax=Streptomyces sp. NPDC059092 TaxID=3346725 RepID=UPI00369677C0